MKFLMLIKNIITSNNIIYIITSNNIILGVVILKSNILINKKRFLITM